LGGFLEALGNFPESPVPTSRGGRIATPGQRASPEEDLAPSLPCTTANGAPARVVQKKKRVEQQPGAAGGPPAAFATAATLLVTMPI